MRFKLSHLPGLLFVLLPPTVAWFELGTGVAALLALLLVLTSWLLMLSGLLSPRKNPRMRLETISASHFSEKVRWALDRLDVPYDEFADAGTLGVFYRGRSVPRLIVPTGMVETSIGNSSDILRYLWGRYGLEDRGRAAFLAPTPEALELEKELDVYGVDLQRWLYHHVFDDRSLCLHLWGANDPAIPLWQRAMIRVVFPFHRWLMRRTFRLNDGRPEDAITRIESLLSRMETRLSDDAVSKMSRTSLSYVDFTLAALSGLWLLPKGYGGGMADAALADPARMPEAMRADIENWKQRFPNVVEFIERLYRTERHRLP